MSTCALSLENFSLYAFNALSNCQFYEVLSCLFFTLGSYILIHQDRYLKDEFKVDGE